MPSLAKLLACGPQGEGILYIEKDKYKILHEACIYENVNTIMNLANINFLTRDDSEIFKLICYNCKKETLEKVIDKFGTYLDLKLGLIEACLHGNYTNFIFLLEKINPQNVDLHELLEYSVKGYDEYRLIYMLKITRIYEIFDHLVNMINNVSSIDYEKLLYINVNTEYSSFTLFKKIFEIVLNSNKEFNINELFKVACLSDSITHAKYLYEKYPNLIEYINSNYGLFIKTCKRSRYSESFCCVKFLADINKRKNYSYYITLYKYSFPRKFLINYRVKNNKGNIITQHICPEIHNKHREDKWDRSDDESDDDSDN